MKVKVTLEISEMPAPVVLELDDFNMEQTRDLICDYDTDGRPINRRENPANPGVMVFIKGRLNKKGS